MPGWFDLYDWPIAVGSKDDKQGLMEGVKTIGSIVDQLRTEGVQRIVVGGFSQGGAVALLSAYHPTGSSVDGCVALSGWLTLANELGTKADRPPLFWGHGLYDDKVLFEQQAYGLEKLSEAGASTIEADQYPIGHSSDSKEIRAMADFLVKVLFTEECAAATNTK